MKDCLSMVAEALEATSPAALAPIAVKIPEWSGGAKRSRVMRNCNGKRDKAPNTILLTTTTLHCFFKIYRKPEMIKSPFCDMRAIIYN